MVLEMSFKGKKLNSGDKVLKSSKIDLVLGDGKVGFDDSELEQKTNTAATSDNEE